MVNIIKTFLRNCLQVYTASIKALIGPQMQIILGRTLVS